MGRKIRSYKGKMIDYDELFSKNKNVQSTGNMNVNANGDHIDTRGNIIKTRDVIAKEYNKAKTTNVIKSSILDDIEDDLPRSVITDDPKVLENKKNKPKTTSPATTIKKTDDSSPDSGKDNI